MEILGSDGAAAAAINLNGGSYDASGTFLALIDGSGAIAFNNASVHADVLKVGALGRNGVLNIGGGILSADTTLKLYASGSNGQLNFTSNVTLGGNSAKILAANSVTIFDNVVVTIGGTSPADVYTGFSGGTPNANYTGSGGNGSTTGTFAGAGANDPQPIRNAPPFDGPGAPEAPAKGSTSSVGTTATIPTTNPGLPGNRGSGGVPTIPRSSPRVAIISVADSNELSDLADKVTSGPIETGHSRSKAPTAGTSRGPGSALSGKGRPLSPTPNVASADLTFSLGGSRRPLSPP